MSRNPIRIIATADAHLDPKCSSFGSRASDRRRDFRKGFQDTVDYAIENQADIFLVAGDLFDGMRPSNSTRAWVMQQFKRLSDTGVQSFIIGGNHDIPKGVSTGVSPIRSHGNSGIVRFFENPSAAEAAEVHIKGKSISIVGIGYNPLLERIDDPLDVQIPEPKSDINILLLHYPVAGFSGFVGEEPLVEQHRIPKGYQITVAGHFHSAQHKKNGENHIIVPGSTERVTFNEADDEKSFTCIEIGDDIEFSQVSLQARPMKTVEVKITPEDDMNTCVSRTLEEHAKAEIILRVLITGTTTPEGLAAYDRQLLLNKGDELCFKAIIEERNLQIKQPDSFEIVGHVDPLDELASYFDSMINSAESEEERIVLEQAKTECMSEMGGME